MAMAAAPLDVAMDEEGKAEKARCLNLWQVANILFYLGSYLVPLVAIQEEAALEPLNFLQPDDFAFGIWFAIILGELVLVWWQALQCRGSAPGKRLRLICALSPGWCAAGLFQALWGLTRTAYFDTAELRWISPLCLSLAAVSLNKTHLAVASVTVNDMADLVMVKFPLTLHFGWLTAASFVAWNNLLARITTSVAVKAPIAAFTVLVASVLGVVITVQRRTPLLGLTIAWALAGLGKEMLTSEALAEAMGSEFAQVMGEFELAMAAVQVAVSAYVILRSSR